MAKKKQFSKESLVKIMVQKANELNKESNEILKAYKKGEMDTNDYKIKYRKIR